MRCESWGDIKEPGKEGGKSEVFRVAASVRRGTTCVGDVTVENGGQARASNSREG